MLNEHLMQPRKPTNDGVLGLLERVIPLLQLLGDHIGNGPIDPERDGSLGVRCDLLGDIHDALAKHKRWTRDGRSLLLDGSYALYIERTVSPTTSNAMLRPVTCDAIADLVCRTLNTVDLETLTREWMNKP